MPFWTDNEAKEPLRQNRWILRIADEKNELQNILYAVKECSKPSFTIESKKHVLLTHTYRFPGNLVWKPITMKFVSTVENGTDSAAKAFMDNVKDLYQIPKDKQQAIGKDALSNKTLNLEIIQVNAAGYEAEKWTLKNAFINDINFGTLSYENEGLVEITCIIEYDWAELETINAEKTEREAKAKKSLEEFNNNVFDGATRPEEVGLPEIPIIKSTDDSNFRQREGRDSNFKVREAREKQQQIENSEKFIKARERVLIDAPLEKIQREIDQANEDANPVSRIRRRVVSPSDSEASPEPDFRQSDRIKEKEREIREIQNSEGYKRAVENKRMADVEGLIDRISDSAEENTQTVINRRTVVSAEKIEEEKRQEFVRRNLI